MSNQFSISTLSDQLSQLRPSSRSSYQQSHGHPLLFRNLTLEAESLYRTLLPSRDELGQRQDLIRRLSSVVTSKVKKWIKESLELEHDVEILLEQFGSTMAGFDMSGADVDLCLIIPDLIKNEDDERFQNFDVKKLLVFVGDVLENDCAMSDVKVLENARVPIVKYRDPISGISGDIGYQNILALWNTRLLRAYADVDYRFRPLAFLVKYWAKRRHINDPYNGTLSSYSYVLLLIHYLQITSPPVLPNLQRLPPSRGQTLTTRIIQGYNTYFFEPTAPDASDHHIFQSPWTFDPLHSVWILKEKNAQSIGELLAGFMHYYAQDFNFFEDVVSIRAGDVISKEGKGWLKVENKDAMNEPEKGTAVDGRDGGDDENDAQIVDVKENENKPAKDKPKSDRYWFCIEDPFETTHNLGRVLTKRSLYETRGEFMRAHRILTPKVQGYRRSGLQVREERLLEELTIEYVGVRSAYVRRKTDKVDKTDEIEGKNSSIEKGEISEPAEKATSGDNSKSKTSAPVPLLNDPSIVSFRLGPPQTHTSTNMPQKSQPYPNSVRGVRTSDNENASFEHANALGRADIGLASASAQRRAPPSPSSLPRAPQLLPPGLSQTPHPIYPSGHAERLGNFGGFNRPPGLPTSSDSSANTELNYVPPHPDLYPQAYRPLGPSHYAQIPPHHFRPPIISQHPQNFSHGAPSQFYSSNQLPPPFVPSHLPPHYLFPQQQMQFHPRPHHNPQLPPHLASLPPHSGGLNQFHPIQRPPPSGLRAEPGQPHRAPSQANLPTSPSERRYHHI